MERGAALLAVLALALGCAHADTAQPVDAPYTNPLQLDAAALLRPELRARLKKSPHHYFRAVNRAFAREVCRRFEPVMVTVPSVELHGDAHLEQIATRDGVAGFADFDDSVSGPAVIDLVRFGTSVSLAARAGGWAPESSVDRVLDAYHASLRGRPTEKVPSAIVRMQTELAASRVDFFAAADSLMTIPVSPEKQAEAAASWAGYVELMLQIDPTRGDAFFRVKKEGHPVAFGIGSAMTKRAFVRIEGATTADDDDVVLEAKEMRDLSDVPCVEGRRSMAVRNVASAARFGGRVDPFLAVVPRTRGEDVDDPPWWIQSWSDRYAETALDTSVATEADLHELAVFGAEQLALGHTDSLPPPYDVQMRRLLSDMITEHRERIVTAISELADLTIDAHQRL